MDQSVVTELVIDADTSGADQFKQSMDGAASSAASTTLAVAGVGVAFVGSLAALRGFVDYVGSVNKQLVDIAENATNAGMSTQEFQQTLFAAKSAGLSDKDFVAGLDKIGADLTAASRGVTDFGKLFEQNGLSIKDTNGQLISTKTAINDIANLMLNATPQVQQGIARIAGLSKDWVGFLRDGSDAIEEQKAAAAALGVTIDDDVIQKAKDFDTQWRVAVATWDLQFKASLAEILPLLIQLANIASTIISTVGSVSSFFSRSLTPVDQMSASDLSKQVDLVAELGDKMASLNGTMSEFQKFKLQNLKGSLGLPEDADLKAVDAYQDKLQEMADQRRQEAEQRPRVLINGGTTLPSTGGDANDAVDRAINTLQRHTEAQLADARAVGLGDAALAGFKADAAETAAVLANHGKETDAQIDRFSDLKDAAIAAAGALAKAKAAASIDFGSKTAFLSQDDVAIAQQLKGIYGNDVPAALASTEAAAIRVNTAFRGVSSAIESNLTNDLTDIAMRTVSVGQGFTNMGLAVVKAIEQMIIKIAIVQPMMQALQNSVGGGGILGFLGLGGSSALAGSVSSGTSLAAGTGGLAFPMFAGGTESAPGGWSVVGEQGPELVRLPQGSQVLPTGKMPSNDNGAPQTIITYAPSIDARGADAQAVARLANVIAEDRKNFERNVRGIMTRARANNPGAF